MLERLLVTSARACAVFVAVIPLATIAALVFTAVVAATRGVVTTSWPEIVVLAVSSVALGLLAATAGTALGVGAALFTVEIAPAPVRQTIKGLIGGLHALPAVAMGVAVAGPILYLGEKAQGTITFLVAAAALAVMLASVVFVQTRRAIAALPAGLRPSAAAVGADEVAIATHAVYPALRSTIAGMWWSMLAIGLGEATAVQLIFAAGGTPGTLASRLLQDGAAARGADAVALAPTALVTAALAVAAVLLGRRAAGRVTWP